MNLMPLEDYVRNIRWLPDRYMDGDTFSLEIDMGWKHRLAVWTKPDGKEAMPRLRLLDVTAPERYEPGGPEATAFTRAWLTEALTYPSTWPLTMQSVELDSFDRFIALVWRKLDGRCLNDDLAAWLAGGAA